MTRFHLLRKNLTRKKLRSGLTLFSILTAFLILGVLVTFQSAMDAGVDFAGADRLVSVNKISFTQPMPYSYYRRVAAVEGVRNVTHANWFGGYYQDPRQFLAVFAVEAESYLDIYPEFILPEDQRESWLKDRMGAAVGKVLADQYGWKVGDTIPLKSNIFSQRDGSQSWDFNISAIITADDPAVDTRFFLLHYDYFNETKSFRIDYLGWLIISVDDPAENEAVSQIIDTMFTNSPFETKTSSEAAFNKAFIEQIGDIGLIITSVVGAAFFTILLVAGNTMALAVKERSREIAVMKALGFSSPRLFRMVLAESLLMALAGGLPGLGLAWLLLGALSSQLGGFLPPLIMTSEVFLQALALMVGLGLLTGAIPAWSVLRLNVVTGLQRS